MVQGKAHSQKISKKHVHRLKLVHMIQQLKNSVKNLKKIDLVTSFDVLEHVERNSVYAVLKEIRDLSSKLVFLQIDLQPAVKKLSSGRNAHIMLAPIQKIWKLQVFLRSGTHPIYFMQMAKYKNLQKLQQKITKMLPWSGHC